MKNVIYFIDPISNRINGYTYNLYQTEEEIPYIPRFLSDSNNNTTGIMYINPFCVITGYNPDYKYKIYDKQNNIFV
jgi:hypothetical protein